MKYWNGLAAFGVLLVAVALTSVPAIRGARADVVLDVAILNGRVMDPGSGLDAVRNVGILGGKIVQITERPLQGREVIDAKDLVVAPGFIDMHEHGQEPRNYQFQAHDGVTTSLELEGGTADVAKWYAAREGKALINYGVSVGHIPVRTAVLTETPPMVRFEISHLKAAEQAAHRAATLEEIKKMQELLDEGFRQGALAEGMGINYTPGASHWEIVEMFRVAAQYHAPVHVHLRYAGMIEPETGLSALEEVIAAAAATGAPLHVVHITSMGMRSTPQLITMVEGAENRGLDVTMECYPYTASSTFLESAVFDEGWRERLAIDYKDLQWAATGERLTAESFAKYRKQGGVVVIYNIPESAARAAISNPMVMIASDGMIITGPKVHPRGQGTFSRVLGHYVREEQALDLMTALRKMTLLPAQRLEKRAPVFQNKGRIRVGADADITIFDPAKIIDKATFEEPLQYSGGISYVLVNGVTVLKAGTLLDGVFPGKQARAPIVQ